MNENNDPLEFEVEEDDFDAFEAQRQINTEKADSEIGGLRTKHERGRLNLRPSYQRNFVWDVKRASLLVESVLLGIPIPMVYFAESNGKLNVIDGQQRLTSLIGFIDGKLPNLVTPFKLTGLKVYTELNGKTFRELSEELQNKILEYPIRTITFKEDSDPNLQYEIFSRLNTGAIALNSQELRNCVFYGDFNDFIKELAETKDFLSLLGLKESHKRMADIELVLRFVSFYYRGYQNYKPPIKRFLNDTMRRFSKFDENDKKDIESAFKNAVLNIKSLFGENAFKRFYIGNSNDHNGRWESKQLNVSLFDVLMDSMARLDPTVVMRHLDSIREAFIDLMISNSDFIKCITLGTSEKSIVTQRFMIWNNVLNEIIKDDKKENRCFSLALKEEMYNTDNVCSICGNKINSIDECSAKSQSPKTLEHGSLVFATR
jgi:hypothetical protein